MNRMLEGVLTVLFFIIPVHFIDLYLLFHLYFMRNICHFQFVRFYSFMSSWQYFFIFGFGLLLEHLTIFTSSLKGSNKVKCHFSIDFLAESFFCASFYKIISSFFLQRVTPLHLNGLWKLRVIAFIFHFSLHYSFIPYIYFFSRRQNNFESHAQRNHQVLS